MRYEESVWFLFLPLTFGFQRIPQAIVDSALNMELLALKPPASQTHPQQHHRHQPHHCLLLTTCLSGADVNKGQISPCYPKRLYAETFIQEVRSGSATGKGTITRIILYVNGGNEAIRCSSPLCQDGWSYMGRGYSGYVRGESILISCFLFCFCL